MDADPPPRIRVLPSELADQIAAGEVVERPASVVKELVENALDAGARRIDVDVEGGGRRSIRVVDDGFGMTPTEMRLALRRHATSKLTALDDLFGLTTMGFRGEALPSIAAVSRFQITSRPPGRDLGWTLAVDGGREIAAEPSGAPTGTQVDVRDLLHNVPARLKFLKAEPTEAAHTTEAMTRLALAYPEAHFRLRHGGRVVLDLGVHETPLQRVQAVLGRRLGARVFVAEGHAQLEEGVCSVRAYLLPPDEAQATSRGVSLFVGRRFVRDRGLLHAVTMGYGDLVPKGRYPMALVFVDPPPGAVDVNVHPQKVEVRFTRAADVTAAVRRTILQAIAQTPWATDGQPAPVSVFAVAQNTSAPARLSDLAERYAAHQEATLFGMVPESAAPSRPRLRYLGQLDRTFLVCEAPDELVLIDQHAAHEKIALQRLRSAHAARGVRVQRLLLPRALELDPGQAEAARQHAEALAQVGFELEPLGGLRFGLRSSPAELRETEVASALLELLSEIASGAAVEDRLDAMLSTIACHSVVRAGDLLGDDEARALIAGLDEVDGRGHSPHGRPVILRLGISELARRFGRT
jgi:DNA mismatch repair protein MutL